MKDRVPLYPGRVTLTPVSGHANTFDLVRADQPTQEGTPLNKASLLKDTTAALFGKTNAAVPDDILSLLSKSVIAQGTKITDVLGNLIAIPAGQIKDGVKIATGSYTGTGTYGSSNPNSLTFEFNPKLVLVNDNYQYGLIAIKGSTGALAAANTMQQYVSWGSNTVSWYCNGTRQSANNQYNAAGTTYNYIAIG